MPVDDASPGVIDYENLGRHPVYNGRRYVGEVLARVQAVGLSKEIVIVDDGSTDGTREYLQHIVDAQRRHESSVAGSPGSAAPLPIDNIVVIMQERNRGKGAALCRGRGLRLPVPGRIAPRAVLLLQAIEMKQNRFGFEPEITAKVAKLRAALQTGSALC